MGNSSAGIEKHLITGFPLNIGTSKSCSSCGYCECGLHVPKYHKCLENYYLHKTVYVNPDFGKVGNYFRIY
jgi:hypothetical protein